MFSATSVGFMALIKIHTVLFVQEALWQTYIDLIKMANAEPIFIRKALFKQMKAFLLSLL